MAASESLREDQTTQDRGKEDKQTWVERKFIIVNFLLIAILLCHFMDLPLLFQQQPNIPRVLIVNLMVADNLPYLKFLLDSFVYAWRIPKYRQALKNVQVTASWPPVKQR